MGSEWMYMNDEYGRRKTTKQCEHHHFVRIRQVVNPNEIQEGYYNLFKVWLIRMKLRENAGELLKDEEKLLNMLKKIWPSLLFDWRWREFVSLESWRLSTYKTTRRHIRCCKDAKSEGHSFRQEYSVRRTRWSTSSKGFLEFSSSSAEDQTHLTWNWFGWMAGLCGAE